MKNGVNGNRSSQNDFMRGGAIMTGSRVDNDEQIVAPSQSKHLLTHFTRGSARLGEILPVDIVHTLPHDDIRMDLTNTAQFQPMNKPTFDNIVTKMHTFAVRYNDIFGDYFKIFYTGGKKGTSKRNLPYYCFIGADSRANSNEFSAEMIIAISMLSWAISHKCNIKDVHRWITKDTDSFDVSRIKLIVNSAFGKGSLLDMFNLGVGEFGNNWTSDSVIPSTVDWRVPTCIPIAPLVAYQLICNKNYRIDDYSYDMFYDYEDIGSKIDRFEQPATNHIHADEIADYTNTDVQIPFGTIIKHLDKIIAREGCDFHLDKDVMEFRLNNDRSWSFTKNGERVPLEPMARGGYDAYDWSFSPSTYMLAWLLSKTSVPMEKDYPTMILPRTQRGVVESIGSGSSVSYGDNIACTVIPYNVTGSKGRNSMVVAQSRIDSHYPNNELWTLKTDSIIHGGEVEQETVPWKYGPRESVYNCSTIPLPELVSNGGTLDMNTLRWINAVTKLAEKKEIVGSDYGKQLLAEFGVEPSWALIDGCQYLGGLVSTPRVEKIDSTANTLANGGSTLADFAGNASQFERGKLTYHSDDFGMVITVMFTYIEASYARFIDRNNFKLYDISSWYNPAYEGLTEQHLYREEFEGVDTYRLMELVNGLEDSNLDRSVLGYVPRNQEYRSMLNCVHGELIPSLGVEDEITWTGARDFNNKYSDGSVINDLSEKDLLYTGTSSKENSRLFQFDTEEFPPITFTCSFGIDALRDVHKIHLPVTL